MNKQKISLALNIILLLSTLFFFAYAMVQKSFAEIGKMREEALAEECQEQYERAASAQALAEEEAARARDEAAKAREAELLATEMKKRLEECQSSK